MGIKKKGVLCEQENHVLSLHLLSISIYHSIHLYMASINIVNDNISKVSLVVSSSSSTTTTTSSINGYSCHRHCCGCCGG